MGVEGSAIYIGDEDSDGSAVVFLPLFPGDVGQANSSVRLSKTEFQARQPLCVTDFDELGITLEIANSGQVISDVVTLEYEVVFCTAASHGALDGFTTSHASEEQSDLLAKYLSMDVVDPGSSVRHRLVFPQIGFSNLKNVYFRARVSTLWTPSVPPDQWDFASDPSVTEAHYRVIS